MDLNQLKDKLAQMETHLQNLIEGSAARVIPGRSAQEGLAARLVEAMRSGAQPAADGSLHAPDLFILSLHPQDARSMEENPAFLQELAGIIQQTGVEAGLKFDAQPEVKITPDQGLAAGHVGVQVRFSVSQLGATSSMAVVLEEGNGAIPENAYLILEGRQIFPVTQAVISIGRRPDNHLIVDDPRVSRLHAQLRANNGRFVIFDLDSSGGTFVNGERLQQRILYPGDVISLAGVMLVFGQESVSLPEDSQGITHPMEPFDSNG